MEVIMETYKAEKNWILNYLILASIPAFYFLQKNFKEIWCYMRSNNKTKVIQSQLNSEIKEYTNTKVQTLEVYFQYRFTAVDWVLIRWACLTKGSKAKADSTRLWNFKNY